MIKILQIGCALKIQMQLQKISLISSIFLTIDKQEIKNSFRFLVAELLLAFLTYSLIFFLYDLI
jgi:hypothetical protein